MRVLGIFGTQSRKKQHRDKVTPIVQALYKSIIIVTNYFE